MSLDLNTELSRLANVLGKANVDLVYLKDLDAYTLMQIRTAFQNSLIDSTALVLERIVIAGKLTPDSVNAVLCQKVFGPELTAQLSYFVPPDQAAALCKRFELDFVVQVAKHQVPERAAEMIGSLPFEVLAKVTEALIDQEEFYVLGGFTDHLDENLILKLMQKISDPIANLQISLFAQKKYRIASILNHMQERQLFEIWKAAQDTKELNDEMSKIISHMSDSQRTSFAKLELAARQGRRFD